MKQHVAFHYSEVQRFYPRLYIHPSHQTSTRILFYFIHVIGFKHTTNCSRFNKKCWSKIRCLGIYSLCSKNKNIPLFLLFLDIQKCSFLSSCNWEAWRGTRVSFLLLLLEHIGQFYKQWCNVTFTCNVPWKNCFPLFICLILSTYMIILKKVFFIILISINTVTSTIELIYSMQQNHWSHVP